MVVIDKNDVIGWSCWCRSEHQQWGRRGGKALRHRHRRRERREVRHLHRHRTALLPLHSRWSPHCSVQHCTISSTLTSHHFVLHSHQPSYRRKKKKRRQSSATLMQMPHLPPSTSYDSAFSSFSLITSLFDVMWYYLLYVIATPLYLFFILTDNHISRTGKGGRVVRCQRKCFTALPHLLSFHLYLNQHWQGW